VEIGPDRLLVAQAYDREDGMLDASPVEWQTDEGRHFRGSHFPSQLLSPGEHRIRCSITDRGGNRSESEAIVHAFHFEGGEHPLGIARDLQRALSALDLMALDQILDPEFRIESCGGTELAQRPDPLSRQEFFSALESVSRDPGIVRFLWGGQIELQAEETRGWAVARWRHLGVLVGRGERDWRMVGLSAEVILRRRPGESWRVVTWRELDRGDGPGVPGLLRSGLPYP
jgi:hypothetical protein